MNNKQYLLVKLAEEASEITQIALKSTHFGLDSDFTGESNLQALAKEFADLLTIVDMLYDEEGVDLYSYSPNAKEVKRAKVEHYRQISRHLKFVA